MTNGGANMKGAIYGNRLPKGTQVKKNFGKHCSGGTMENNTQFVFGPGYELGVRRIQVRSFVWRKGYRVGVNVP